LDTLASAIRKLESDARLAAGKVCVCFAHTKKKQPFNPPLTPWPFLLYIEIGQSLLHKHEQSVITSNEIKSNLEQQVT
jgi:hypothetical protein